MFKANEALTVLYKIWKEWSEYFDKIGIHTDVIVKDYFDNNPVNQNPSSE
jgi:hypothetical protein